MKHYEFEISQYVEGELPPGKKEELLSHLSKCKKCSKTLDEYERLKNNIADFYKAVPSYTNNNLIVSNRNYRHFKNNWRVRYVVPLATAALIIFLFLTRESLFMHKPGIHNSISVNQKTEKIKQEEKFPTLSASEIETGTNLNDYKNIIVFNKIIDKAIEKRDKGLISSQLFNTGYHLTQKEFNEGINSVLYPSD